MALPASFWDNVPPIDIRAYLKDIDEDSPVGATEAARDCEVQALCQLRFHMEGQEFVDDLIQSRVNIRQKIFGEWTDDDSSFSEEEVLKLRTWVKPWTARGPAGP